MKNKSLTKKMKEALVQAISHQCSSENCFMAESLLAQIATKAYVDTFGEDIKTFEKLPPSIVPVVNMLPLEIYAPNGTVVTKEIRLASPLRYGQGMAVPRISKEVSVEVIECLKTVTSEADKNAHVVEAITKAIDSVSGTNRLIAVWPEVTHIVSELFMSNDDLRDGVPEEVLAAKDIISEFMAPEPIVETTEENIEEAEEMAATENEAEDTV